MKYLLKIFYLFLCFLYAPIVLVAQSDFSVLNYWQFYSDAENTLYKQQCDLAFKNLDERKKEIAQLTSKSDWQERQQKVRKKLDELVGPFPGKTALNPVITGTIKGDGFKVEKLYFKSLPGVKVTAAFFIPDGKKKDLPTIIYCSGHTDLAFRSDTYQHVILNLVKKGFAVLAFDPYGQGERQQYFDGKTGKSKFGSTREHSYPGAQLFINGASAARYMIWDGIRCVDYLLTRKEVDPERIGITGRSGGGTQTTIIAAFDDRISASAPECYITSLEYLLKSKGPQDAEQNLPHSIGSRIDHADLIEVRAPKPTLMITTTRDMFSIQGARETYKEAKIAYQALGYVENMSMVSDDAGHASTLKNREAMYQFFQKHFENPGSSTDLEVEPFSVEELYVTETGQLSTSIGSKFLYDIGLDIAQSNYEKLDAKRSDMGVFASGMVDIVKEVSGFDEIENYGKLVFSGRTEFENYFIDTYLIEVSAQNILPFVCLRPKDLTGKLVMYLDDLKDKKSEKAYEIPLKLVRAGNMVIVPDLPGYGALGPGYLKGDAYFNNTSYNQWFAGILNGKTMMAIHSESIQVILKHCYTNLKMSDLTLVGISKGAFNSSLLHASVSGSQFSEIILIEPLMSMASLTLNKEYEPSFVPFTVAGSLEHYDLPDLAAMFAPKPFTVINPLNQLAQTTEKSEFQQIYGHVSEYYTSQNANENFSIFINEPEDQVSNIILDQIKKH